MASARDPNGLGEWPERSARRTIVGELAAFALDKLEEDDDTVRGAVVLVETDDGVRWFSSGGLMYARGLIDTAQEVVWKRRSREDKEAE